MICLKNSFAVKYKSAKYLKEDYGLVNLDQYFFAKHFPIDISGVKDIAKSGRGH